MLQRPREPGRYVSKQFAELCDTLGVIRSRGAVGASPDNAAAEAFNATLKRETCKAPTLARARAARLAVFRWITRYSTRRLHSARPPQPDRLRTPIRDPSDSRITTRVYASGTSAPWLRESDLTV